MTSNRKDDDQEMSMEEILASIRKYVTEDPEDLQKAKQNPVTSYEKEEEVLDLKKIEESLNPIQKSEAFANSGSYEKEFSSQTSMNQEPFYNQLKTGAKNMPVPEKQPYQNVQPNIDVENAIALCEKKDRLTSEQTLSASAQALNRLMEAKKPNVPFCPSDARVSVDVLVIEALKPMLKQWLDANLVNLVEKIVQSEIEKLTQEVLTQQ